MQNAGACTAAVTSLLQSERVSSTSRKIEQTKSDRAGGSYILRGHFLRVFADAKSLTLLKTCSTSSPYLSRLAMELSIYDFELFHLPGKLNIETDALSRMTKTQDKILSNDKQKGTAMTKDESLLFLEYLTIPTDHHFTQNEVRQLLTSEPLRTELKAKVKTRIASAKKTKENNGPHTGNSS